MVDIIPLSGAVSNVYQTAGLDYISAVKTAATSHVGDSAKEVGLASIDLVSVAKPLGMLLLVCPLQCPSVVIRDGLHSNATCVGAIAQVID